MPAPPDPLNDEDLLGLDVPDILHALLAPMESPASYPTLHTVKVRTVYCATGGAERPPCYSKYGPKPILFATVTLSRIKQPTLNLKRSASVDNARRFSTFSLHNWL